MLLQRFFTYFLCAQLIASTTSVSFAATANEAAAVNESTLDLETIKEQAGVFKGLYENLLGSYKPNPLDFFSLLRQDFLSENAKVTSIDPRGVYLEVFKDYQRIKGFRASDSLYSNFDASLGQEYADRFVLSIEGKPVHQFRVPIEALAIVGNFIVFVERNSFDPNERIRHLSFIDLNYFRLAKSELPIFRVPIEGQASIESIRVENKNLYINNKSYQEGLFEFSASMQRILYNLSVNATSPEHLLRIFNALEPYMDYFNANLQKVALDSNADQKQELERTMQKQLDAWKTVNEKGNALEEGTLKTLGENFWQPIEETHKKMAANLQAQRGIIGRTGILWQRLSTPRPAEVSSLKEKLIHLAVGIYKRQIQKADMYEVAAELGSNKQVRITTAMLSAAAFSYYMPEASLAAIMNTLEVGIYLSEAAFGKFYALMDLSWNTAKATFAGLNPVKLYEVYIADGAWVRTSVGVSAMFSILAMVVGIPHIIVNSYHLVKDFRTKEFLRLPRPEGMPELYTYLYTFKYHRLSVVAKDIKTYFTDVLPGIVPKFIERQQDLRKAYLEALSDEKRKTQTIDTSVSNEELDREAREFIETFMHEKSLKVNLISRISKSRIWTYIGAYVQTNLPTLANAASNVRSYTQKMQNIENFAGAMTHFLFSFAAFTKSGIFYVTSWNYFFLSRALVFKPKLAVTFLFFPNYFRRSVATDLGKVTPPSFWNGGTRWIWQEAAHQWDRISDKEYFTEVNRFEAEVVSVEKQINTQALKEAYKALQKYLGYQADVALRLSENKEKLTTDALGAMSYDAKSLFTIYFDKLIEVAMAKYLQEVASKEDPQFNESDKRKIKEYFIHNQLNIKADGVDIAQLVKDIAADPTLYEEAKRIVEDSSHFIEKQVSRQRHLTYWNLDPAHSGQFSRFVNAEIQMKKASSMARAIRANIVATLVDKPMELAILFLLAAGVTDGPNKPLWDVMFSQDAAFYLSRNVFMGYTAGLIVSIFADVWVKVQRDIRVESLDGFDKIPEGEMANRPFRSWYKHLFFTDINNKWIDHQKNDSRLIYHNLGPAFVLYVVTGMATMGRVDIDFYTLGYISAFLLPFTGLSAKLEQTFDIASGWVLRHVPKRLHSHPLIIEWANREITSLRVGFQIYYKLYENIIGQWIGNLMALTTQMSGTRALSRILFGGKTITEHMIETTTNLASHQIPGARFVDNACRLLFTNNYNSGPLPPPPKD